MPSQIDHNIALNPTQPTPQPLLTHLFREAYEALQSEIDSVKPDDFAHMNTDIIASVIMVLGREAELRSFKDQVMKELPSFDIRYLENIGTYARALGFTHSRFTVAATAAPISELMDELTKARDTLFSDVSALAKRNLLDGQKLGELRGTNGYKNLVFDVLTLGTMLRDNWSAIEGRTGVQIEELDRMDALVDRLATAVGQKEQGPSVANPAAETRQRAYTLFVRAYDQVRRAIGYLRWDQDDAERIAPSLFAGRGGRRKDATQDPSTDPTAPDPIAPAPAARVPAAPSPGPAAPVTASPNGPSAPAPAIVTNGAPKPFSPAGIGMPNGDPLGRS